ncbi:tetratricopeptide repeat-containing sulfotransferase family protein [Aestuariivita boseongensis]|uniref:tetratricopeptide repeat-containing sulfotransferase family protein n=1 Tax=Aestuariivita boseongensis TaxID=1470562 RepID=UPI0006805D7D|nr:tetratricopeptide repeat-containing sulfotransferase family protein [Aestuariivita boseongensis]
MTSQTDLAQIRALLQAGQFKSALKACKDGLRRYPKEAGFANFAGIALSQSGKPKEAIPFFVKAVKRAPGNADCQDNLLRAYIQAGQFKQADALAAQLLERRPEDGELHYQIALLEMQRDHMTKAQEAADKVIAADRAALEAAGTPSQDLRVKAARGHNLRAVIRERAGDEDGAFDDYRASLDLNPNSPDTLSNIALQLSMRMQPDAALAALEKALSIHPRHILALQRYAIQLNENGRRAEAADAMRMALELDPLNADFLRSLSRMETRDGAQALIPQIEAALKKVRKNSLDAAQMSFALAHCLEKTGQDATESYRQANEAARAQRPHDLQASQARQDTILAQFPLDRPLPQADRTDGPRPIFVLGQPRSGTTLIEVMLAAHPDIATAGEQAIMGRLVHPFTTGKTFTEADAKALAEDYRTSLPGKDGPYAAIIDKMPANYQYIGFILSAFPDAVVLSTLRDPRDVAWSMWRNWFPNAALNYVFDMAAMAEEANIYARYMAHWKALAPDRVHDVSYEALVRDVDGESRRLAQLCGVDWLPEMAAPERSAQAVRTASANQVRQPVHTGSIGGWADQAEDMRPFLERLDPALWPDLSR